MTDKSKIFSFFDKEYNVDQVSELAQSIYILLKFSTERVGEMENQVAILRRAKKSYINSLKKQILSDKAGFLFEDN